MERAKPYVTLEEMVTLHLRCQALRAHCEPLRLRARDAVVRSREMRAIARVVLTRVRRARCLDRFQPGC